jgi:hypothetical protein
MSNENRESQIAVIAMVVEPSPVTTLAAGLSTTPTAPQFSPAANVKAPGLSLEAASWRSAPATPTAFVSCSVAVFV